MFRDSKLTKILAELRKLDADILKESEANENVQKVPQTMKPQEDAEVETPDDMEDLEKEDLNKLDVSKKKDRKDIIKEPSDKELEVKPQESKRIPRGLLYLCNSCCKTFENKEPVCTFCKSKKVELISEQKINCFRHVYDVKYEDKDGKEDVVRVTAEGESEASRYVKRIKPGIEKVINVELISEGYEERGVRDRTGPFKGSAQRSISKVGRRKQAGEVCPQEETDEDNKNLIEDIIVGDIVQLAQKGDIYGISIFSQGEVRAIDGDEVDVWFDLSHDLSHEGKLITIQKDSLKVVPNVTGGKVPEAKTNETLDKGSSLHILFRDLSSQAKREVLAYFEKKEILDDFVVAIVNPSEVEESKTNEVEEKSISKDKYRALIQNSRESYKMVFPKYSDAKIEKLVEEYIRVLLRDIKVEESKTDEADEEGDYITVGKGLEKDDADKLATEKNGTVVNDDKDKEKFSVIVKKV